MICPYRKIVKTFTATDNSRVTSEEFAECYYTQCPWYWKSNGEGCSKVDTEYMNGGRAK